MAIKMRKRCNKMQALILVAVLCVSVLLGESKTYADIGWSENLFSMYTDAAANVFFGEEVPKFRVKMQNPYQYKLALTIKSQVIGRDNTIVWSGSKKVTLAPKETAVAGIAIDDKKLPYGMYRFQAEVSSSSSVSFSKSLEFAVSVENKDTNDWASVNFHLGDYFDYEDFDKNLEFAKKAGFSRNRDDVRWYRTETEVGNLQLPEWRRNIIDKTLESGQHSPIYILGIEHSVYTGGLCPHEYDPVGCANHSCCSGKYTFEQQIDAYARFCAYMAEELKGTKPVFELGNEPDIYRVRNNLSAKVNFTGQQYAELVKAAYSAIKKVDPDATVVSAGLCPFVNDNSRGFLQEFLSVKDITKYIDGLGLHPYPNYNYTDEISTGAGAFHYQVNFAKENLDLAMERDGTSGIMLWVTEFGGRSEESWTQAAVDVRTMIMSRAEPSIQAMNIYNLVSKGTDLTEAENRFGIIKKNYTGINPAYLALSHMNMRLAGAEYKDGIFQRVYNDQRNFSAYGFKRETELTKQYTYVLWGHTGKSAALTVEKSGANESASVLTETEQQPTITVAENAEVKIYDMVGNEISQSASYALSGEPVYVVSTIRSEETVKMEKDGCRVTIKGRASSPNEEVTLLVVKENSLTPAYAAFEQTVSDNLSEYDFSFSLPQEDSQYSVYVFDGEEKRFVGRDAKLSDIKLQYFVNGNPTDNLETVGVNDTIRVKLTLNKIAEDVGNLRFYGVIYGKPDTLLSADVKNIVWNSSSGTAEVELKAADSSEPNAVKFFLWDEDQIPVTPPLEVRQ